MAATVQPDATMLFKVYGGTPLNDGQALCDTCRHSSIVRGRRIEEEIVFCDGVAAMHPVRITFKVTSCSIYLDDREPSYQELCEKAWILRPATHRRPAGFVRAAELKGEEARRLLYDPTED